MPNNTQNLNFLQLTLYSNFTTSYLKRVTLLQIQIVSNGTVNGSPSMKTQQAIQTSFSPLLNNNNIMEVWW